MKSVYPYLLGLLLLFTPFAVSCQQTWDSFIRDFQDAYEERNIARLSMVYQDNLKAIPDLDELGKQERFCKRSWKQLESFNRDDLSPQSQLEYDLLTYQLALFKERLNLEKEWATHRPDSIHTGGLIHNPLGKEIYALSLKRWLDAEVHPDSLFQFGLKEVERIKANMKKIQLDSGKDSLEFAAFLEAKSFYYQDIASTQKALEEFAASIQDLMPTYFPDVAATPPLKIEEGGDGRLAQVPGYYRNNTFFYNFFDTPFNKRQVGWLYMHEGVPGHHYEINHRSLVQMSPLQYLFYSRGYSEGWAAYIEDLALEIGAYRDIYDEYGKWEWDIIRSVRVPLDIGINYYGWSDEECMAFWRKHIQGIDDIARREIARMKRWPCQVITYKYGTRKILDWKKEWEKREDFSLLAFHTNLLARGPLPFTLLEDIMLNNAYAVQK
ncbi:MAG: DUF885 domain-containing protein [Bacteroidota bacterium]